MPKYQIQIPEPCNEDWNKMTPFNKGKFCSSCKKEVIDFTQVSNTELARLIKKGNSVCGKFKESQLNTDIASYTNTPIQKIGLYFGLASFLGASTPIIAQKQQLKTVQYQENKKDSAFKNKKDSLIIIKGIVSDETGPLPGVSVTIKERKNGVETNFDGEFFIEIDKNLINKNASLIFKFIGYSTKEVLISEILDSKNYNLILKEDSSILDEVVTVAGGVCIIKKDSLFDKLKIIKTDSILKKLKLINKNK